MKICNRTNKKIKIKGIIQQQGSGDYDIAEIILTSGEFSSDCSHFDLIEIFEEK